MRPICSFLRENVPFYHIAGNILIALVAGASFLVIYKLKIEGHIKKKLTVVLLVCCSLIFAVVIWQFKLTEEKIHFFEYGLLGFLAYRAFNIDIKGFRAYIFTFILIFILGWTDEGIQYILPNRYYDLRDVLMNAGGGLMGLLITLVVNMDE
ncbi:MAG: VanZ family protein [Candidatus Omnitrophica bacterium]|nr:VanZ family protein [Candidatus Omnitrophota bacterium]